MTEIPTFSTGFALNPTESQYPHLWKDLSGAWAPFVGKQGNTLYDFSTYRRSAILTNMDPSTDYIVGPFGYALNYDGTDDHAVVGKILEINESDQSMSVAFRIRTSTAQTEHAIMTYSANDILQPNADWYIMLKTTLVLGGFGDSSERNTGVVIADGEWHYIVIVENQSTLKVYKDGAEVFSVAISQSQSDFNLNSELKFCDDLNVNHFTGDLGEVLLYNRALLPSEAIDLSLNKSPLTPRRVGIQPQLPEVLSILIQEAIELSETTDLKSFQDDLTLIENLQFTENIITSTVQQASFVSKLISVNPLYAVTDTDPAAIVEIDISAPSAPTFIVRDLVGAKNARDIALNTETNELFVACADGIIVRVDASDTSIQSIIDVSDLDDIQTIETFSTFGLTYAGTENSTGELYLLDDRTELAMDSNLQVIQPNEFLVESDFNAIEFLSMDSDMQAIAENTVTMDSNFKALDLIASPSPSPIVDQIVPIAQTDFHVFIDAVELDSVDLILDSIIIEKTVDEKERAQFILCRKHDDLDKNLLGASVPITSQNAVEIRLKNTIVFTGKVSEIQPRYDVQTDQVIVQALGDISTIKFNNVKMSLPRLTERLNLYHIFLQNYNINDPFVDLNEENPTIFKGVRASLGNKVEQNVTRRTFFDSFGSVANDIQSGDFNPQQNHTYFWSPTVTKFGNFNLGQTSSITAAYVGTSLAPVTTDLWDLTNAKHRRQRIFEDKITKLGDGSITPSDLDDIVEDSTAVFNELINNVMIDGAGVITRRFKETQIPSELNLSISSCEESDVYELLEISLGFSLGEAPFNEISARNGEFIPMFRYSDESNGLFSIRDEAFDFTEYVKQVVALEFEKILNINGTVLPQTSATIGTSIDSFLYFDLGVLTRLNIDNTTQTDIYNNNNGFPVSIKSIILNSGSMRTIIQSDNIKSSVELEEIDGQFPCEDDQEFVEPEQRILISPKTDLRTRLEVE